MRVLLRIALCACLVAAGATAQRRGGGGAGGFHGGGAVGGFHGGGGGWGYSGFRGGLGYRSYGYGGYYGGFYGGFYGGSYWPGYYDYSYSPYAYSYPYSYDTSPNVTEIYPAPAQAARSTGYVERADPVPGQCDQYGQEIKSSSGTGDSPIYLLAFADHAIRAAEAYWVDGKTLHYITLDYEQKQAPLDTVDRDLSLQLNRERRVAFSLP